MRSPITLLLLLILPTIGSFAGCQTTKEAVGNYVVEATTQELLNRLDRTLANHNTSLAQITSVLDTNHDGQTTRTEVLAETSETIKDAATAEALKYINSTIQSNNDKILALAATGQSTTKHELINYILGLVAAYLAKQIYSAKADGKRDAKLLLLERLTNRDIDGDGVVGGSGEAAGKK